jgi:hypothetical protein
MDIELSLIELAGTVAFQAFIAGSLVNVSRRLCVDSR